MKKSFLSFVVLVMATFVNAQNFNIDTLLNVYNCNSLEKALIKINKIHTFNGKNVFDSLQMKSTLKGHFGNGYLIVSSLKEKTEIVIELYDKSIFEDLLSQAKQKFTLDKDWILPSEYLVQEMYTFLDTEKRIELLLSKHNAKSNSSNYGLPKSDIYQVKLTNPIY